jgi:hypothetical protein
MKRKISKSDWLRFHGLRASPFDGLQAEVEFASHLDFMLRSFVEPDGFDRVLGSMDSMEHTLLFAESGMGKSMCRLIADYYYRNSDLFRENEQWVLSVSHTHFAQVRAMALAQASEAKNKSLKDEINKQKDKSKGGTKGTQNNSFLEEEIALVNFSHHLYEIMSRMISSFVELIRSDTKFRLKISELPRQEKIFLSRLISPFAIYLDFFQVNLINNIGIPLSQPADLRIIIKEEDLFWILQSLELFVQWIKRIGISKIFVLVDGANKIEPVGINSLLIMDILRPLFANLSILGQKFGIVIKLFLPAELKGYIIFDYGLNLEVNVALLDLAWSKEGLLKILHERLAASKNDLGRDRTETSFDLFCAPDLRGRIENDLVRVARNNPRILLKVCGAMLDSHCSKEHSQDQLYWLTSEDWKSSIELYLKSETIDFKNNDTPLTQEEIIEIISRGENSELEFKSSTRWDYELNKTNKALLGVIVKTITGMLNANGGSLLIGVKDNGEILGIEKDILTLSPPNLDAYERFLIDSVKDYIGLEHTNFVKVQFIKIQEKTICEIKIRKAVEPVFMKSNSSEEFWVRTGNSTRSLSPRSTYIYITQHWKT